MLSALRLSLARPCLGRPSRGRLVVGVPAAVPRSGDGAGRQRPPLRRPKPRLPPLPADEAAEALEPGSPRQRQAAAGQPGSANALGGAELMRQIKGAQSSQTVVRLVQQAGPSCRSRHFATAINRVAKLQQQRRSPSNQAAFAALLAFAEQHPAVLNHAAVAQTAYAGGVLYHRLAAQQQAAWQERLVWAFAHPELRSNELANSLWGWSRMGLPLQGQLAAAANAATQRMAGQMNAQEVANTLWAAAKLGLRLSGSLTAALLERLEQVLPQATAQAVANSLWAAAKLGLRLSDSLKAAFVQAVLRIMPAATSQALANIVLACGTLRWNPGGRVLAAAVAAMQRLLAAGVVKVQELRNFLWGLAELQKRWAKLPSVPDTLLDAAVDWAGSRWAQLAALEVTYLCYNLARLGHRPGRAWVGRAAGRCLECITAHDLRAARFSTFIWACSKWGHQLQRSQLEPLVPAAVDSICADWPDPGRGGALRLGEGLAWQEGFQVGPSYPAATAALQRLLPLLCTDFDLIVSDRLKPETSELRYLATWSAHMAAIGLRLPEQQLQAVCSFLGRLSCKVRRGDKSDFESAFRTWDYQPGLARLEQLAVA